MNESIYLKYLWHTKDAVKAYKHHRRSSITFKNFSFAYIFIGIASIVSGLYSVIIEQQLESIDSILFGVFFISINKIQLYFYGRSFKKLNYENKQVEWEISEDKIEHRMLNLFESCLNWDLIHGVLDTPEGFLLYPQKNVFYWLPKEAFNSKEDITQFTYLARDKVKNWQQIK